MMVEKITIKTICPKCNTKETYIGKAKRPQIKCPKCDKRYWALSNVDKELPKKNENKNIKNDVKKDKNDVKKNEIVGNSVETSIKNDVKNIINDVKIKNEIIYLLDNLNEDLDRVWGLNNNYNKRNENYHNKPRYKNLWKDWRRLKLLIENEVNNK